MALSSAQQEVSDFVKRTLGFPTLCVELDVGHFEDAIGEAEIWLQANLGQISWADFTCVGAQSEYPVVDDVASVIDVVLPGTDQNLDLIINPSAFADTNELPYAYYANSLGGGMASGLYQFMQYIETTRRVLSADTDWVWDEVRRLIVIRPATKTGPAKYWYVTNSMRYERLTKQQLWLLRRYALAWTKMTLGNIRSKYSELPAAGSRVGLNGGDLIAQAQEEFLTLDEKVKVLAPPLPFLTG